MLKASEWVLTRIGRSHASRDRQDLRGQLRVLPLECQDHNDELPGLTDSILILIQHLHIDTATRTHTINNYQEEGHIGIRVCIERERESESE